MVVVGQLCSFGFYRGGGVIAHIQFCCLLQGGLSFSGG